MLIIIKGIAATEMLPYNACYDAEIRNAQVLQSSAGISKTPMNAIKPVHPHYGYAARFRRFGDEATVLSSCEFLPAIRVPDWKHPNHFVNA
jgi:hypothetical protein